jgi:glyoxylate reductase
MGPQRRPAGRPHTDGPPHGLESVSFDDLLARSGVVDHDALREALTAGTIAGAALDVTEPEPLPRGHPLLTLSNVVIVPHWGSASDRTRRRRQEMTVENLRAGLRGEPLPYQVRPAP